MKESFGHNKISFNDFVREKNLGPETEKIFKQFLQDKCRCADCDEINEATLYRAYDNFRQYIATHNFFYPDNKINFEESFDNKVAIVIKEEYITDFVEKCSETWNGLKKDGYDVGVKEPNWLAIPAVPGIFSEYFYCKFIINPDTKTVKYIIKVDRHNEVVLNESIEDFDSKFHRSYQFAKDKHDATGAILKFSGAPYIVHPDGVAKIVDAYGGDDDQVKIAVLHDTIEDTDTNFDEIEDLFGEEVATGVEMLSNDKDEIDKMGKETYMSKKLLNLPEKYLFIKLADIMYNILDHPKESQLERMINNLIALSRNRRLSKKCNEILDACLEAAAFQVN